MERWASGVVRMGSRRIVGARVDDQYPRLNLPALHPPMILKLAVSIVLT